MRVQPVRGIFRSHAYIDGVSKYCCELQMDTIPMDIIQGGQEMLDATLVNPVGFGHNLREGVMLTLRDGVSLVGKAIILKINNNHFFPKTLRS